MDGTFPGKAADSGTATTIVTEGRRQVGILFGFLVLVFAVVLVRGVTGAQATSGRVAAGIFGGVFVVAFIAGWVVMIRRPARLEVTEDAIRYVSRNGRVSSLSRQWGDELCFVQRLRGRIWTLGLTIVGTDTVITLGFFSRNAVKQACRARGWRFDDQVRRQRGIRNTRP